MRPSHHSRLLIVCGVLLIGAVVAGIVFAISNLRERALSESERELANTVRILSEQIDRTFQAISLVQEAVTDDIQALGITTHDDFRLAMSRKDIHDRLHYKAQALIQIDGFTIVDAEGKLLNSSGSWPVRNQNIADQVYLKALKSNPDLKSYVSKPVQRNGGDMWVVYLGRKVTTANGELLGFILGTVELSYFERTFAAINLGKDAWISLFRNDGVLLVNYPWTESIIGRTFTNSPRAVENGDRGTIRYFSKLRGRDRILAADRVTEFPLYVAASQDTGAVLANWRQDEQALLSISILAILAITTILYLFHRQFAQRDRLSEQQLALEKQRLETAVNNMSQGLLLFDSSERLVICNNYYLDMYGLTQDQVKPGLTIRDLVQLRKGSAGFKGDFESYYSDLVQGVMNGTVCERLTKTVDGRSIKVANHPLPDGGWVSIHEDVTEKLSIDLERERERAFLQQIIDNVPVMIAVKDAKTRRFVLVNRAAEAIWGIPSQNTVGKTDHEVFTQAQADKILAVDDQALSSSEPLYLDAHPSFGRTDSKITVTSKRIVIYGRDNEPQYLICVIEDVTTQKQLEQERDENREFLQTIIDNVPMMITVKDATTRRYLLANPAVKAIWNISATAVMGKTPEEIFPPERADQIRANDESALKSAQPLILSTYPLRSESGEALVVNSKRIVVRDADGKPRYLVSVVEDVTERTRLERERDRNRQFLHQIIDNVPTSIIVKNANDRRYVLFNRAAETYHGAMRHSVIGKTAEEVWPKKTAELIAQHDQELLESEGYLFIDEHAVDTAGLGQRLITAKRLVVRDERQQPQYLVAVINDVTERKNSQQRIAHLAHYDALTDLPNRVFFREQVNQRLKQMHADAYLAVLHLDLDRFKGINDTLGHPVGDELLKAVAIRLRGCLNETDVAGRLGGDEYAIMRPDVADPKEVIDFVNQIQDAIRAPFEIGDHRLVTDISIGIALAPDDGTDVDVLLKNANLAMYGAKIEGRSTYRFFEADMDARVKAQRSLEADLREAIRQGDFELHYQPIINLDDNRIAGCECLLRWQHAVRGAVSPESYIPIAEEAGLIVSLGEWVLRTACAEAATWPDDVKIAVNVSPVQFKSANFVQIIINALAASQLLPARLELEVTEAVLIRDDDVALAILQQLRSLGVRVAMDDFGTGYSSLSYLQRFPFDKIKIDRSFINDVTDNGASLSIVKAVIGIAKARDITTTAEGVETEAQLKLLRKLGCTQIQGFLVNRPMPAAEARKLLSTSSANASSAA